MVQEIVFPCNLIEHLRHLLLFSGSDFLIRLHLIGFHLLRHGVKIGAKFQPYKSKPPAHGSLARCSRDGAGGLQAQYLGTLLKNHIDRDSRFAEAVQVRLELSRDPAKSEEHTSELQSRENLVCRLL